MFAQHSVCAESGHLVEGGPAAQPREATAEGVSQGTPPDADVHCVVLDAMRTSVALSQALVFAVVVHGEVALLGSALPAWNRSALIDAPKASPPARV